jgi:hypothetical protein
VHGCGEGATSSLFSMDPRKKEDKKKEEKKTGAAPVSHYY